MAMKAQAGTVASSANSSSREVRRENADVRPLDPELDQLVMVLFPKSSWDAVMELAQDMGVTAQDVIGAALLNLRAQVDAQRAKEAKDAAGDR